MAGKRRAYNDVYRGEYRNRVAFPLGGIGAGMECCFVNTGRSGVERIVGP